PAISRPSLHDALRIVVSTPAAASTPQSMPEADTVRVITATMGLALTEVRVRASSSSTQENMKQKNAVTPMPEPISGMKIFTKKQIGRAQSELQSRENL